MSVINDMLRDLETRKAPAHETNSSPAQASIVQASSGNGRAVLLGAVVASSVISLSALTYMYGKEASLALPQEPEKQLVEKTAEPDARPKAESGAMAQDTFSEETFSQDALSENAGLAELKVQEPAAELTLEASKQAPVPTTPPRVTENQQALSQTVREQTPPSPRAVATVQSVEITAVVENTQAVEKYPPAEQVQALSKEPTESHEIHTRVAHSSAVHTTLTPGSDDRVNNLADEIVDERANGVKGTASVTESFSSLALTLSPEAEDQQAAKQASRMFEQGQVRQAYRDLYAFIASHRVDGQARAVLASRLLAEQRFAEAGDVLIAGDVSNDRILRQIKARWLMATNNTELAVSVLESDLPAVAEDSAYHALLASCYQQAKQFEQSIARYSALLEYDANRADWWVGMGIGLDHLKRYPDAALAYQQALALPSLQPSLANYSQHRLKQITL